MKFHQFIILVLFFIYSGTIVAQTGETAKDNDALSRLEYTSAKIIKDPKPVYPREAEENGQEGWVIVSYIVSEKGNVENSMIEDSSGSRLFEHAALATLNRWKYKPAMRNGKPVEQSMTKQKIVFRFYETEKGAGHSFIRKYKKIQKLIDEKIFDQAKMEIDDLQFKEKKNLYEDAWFWLLKYLYLDATKSTDEDEREECLERAIGYDTVYLPTDFYVYAIENLYKSQVKDVDYNAAISTFKRLNNVKPREQTGLYKQVHGILAAHVQKLYKIINGNAILALNASIKKNSVWVHNLIRKSFSIGKVNGDLQDVEIRCNASYVKNLNRSSVKRKFSFSQNSTWNIPASWKDCGLYVKGEQGTTFTLYEYPFAHGEEVQATN